MNEISTNEDQVTFFVTYVNMLLKITNSQTFDNYCSCTCLLSR